MRLVSYGAAILLLTLPATSLFASRECRPSPATGFEYPAGRTELFRQVETFIKMPSIESELSTVHAIIVPHAPYVYVGTIMGAGYSQLIGRGYDRIIILGCDASAETPAMFIGSNFATPLGQLRSDDSLAVEIMSNCNVEFSVISPDKALPSSIEEQLPFIQYLYGERPILAIGLSDQSPLDAIEIGSSIAQVLAGSSPSRTLIIGVANLSEYFSSEIGEGIDRTLIERMSDFDFEVFVADSELGRIQSSSPAVILATLKAAHDLGSNHFQLLRYATSSSLIGDHYPSVGFLAGAVGISKDSPKLADACIPYHDGECYLQLAREVIAVELGIPLSRERRPIQIRDASLDGIYLTIHLSGELRGSSTLLFPGTSISDAVRLAARTAAFSDPRFNPIASNELDDIRIAVHLLTNSRRVVAPEDFKVNENAVYIRKGNSSTMILSGDISPDLSNVEFLGRACIRAGLFSNCWRQGETTVIAFDVQYFEEER